MSTSSSLTEQLLQQYDSDAARTFYRRVMGGGGSHIHYGIFPDGQVGPPDLQAAAERSVAVLGDQLLAALGGAPIRMLDMGSGTGGPARANAERFGCAIVGLNLCPAQNQEARRLLHRHGLADQVRILDANFDRPWPETFDAAFDAVWSQEAFCHSDNQGALLSRVARSLRPGGVLAFTDVLASPDARAADLRAFTRLNATTSLARASDYAQMIADAGLELVSHTDLTRHLHRTFEAMLHEVRESGVHLVEQGVSRAHLDRYEASLQQRIHLSAESPLGWGAFVARRPERERVRPGPASARGVMTERVDGAFASSEMAEGPVLVIGAGHVGTFLARELARNLGGRVLLKHRAGSLPRPEVRAICERCGVEVISELDSLAGCRVRAVLLATKTFDHATALHELDRARIRGPRCAVFNGLVPPDALPGVVPCVTFGSWDFVPGTTRMIARNPSVPWRLPPEGRAIAALLGMAGIPAIASDEFRRWQLHKFIVNASANLLSVKRDQHCAGLLAHHRSELMQLLDEIVRVISQDAGDAAVLRAIAPVQPGQSPADALLGVLEDALRSYGSHHPSTWHDHRRGRRLEVDALNGYVLAAAAGAGVRVPHHAALLASLAEAS